MGVPITSLASRVASGGALVGDASTDRRAEVMGLGRLWPLVLLVLDLFLVALLVWDVGRREASGLVDRRSPLRRARGWLIYLAARPPLPEAGI